jgi:hypothetical protein
MPQPAAPPDNPLSETAFRGETTMEQSAVREPLGRPDPLFMEHRWGRRLSCRASVRLCAGDGRSGAGHIRDVSSSGAFIETALVLPECTPVTLVVLGNESATKVVEAAAIVVRTQPDGMGIEWTDAPAGSICAALGCTTRCTAGNHP